ncbi:MAG: nucleotide pyrophosphohydrolase [Candidatus Bathyarchaeota archaeon]|nr:nucleotide pyrophosphohydrolase [Candidatus Bathyarchaeota archaeon]
MSDTETSVEDLKIAVRTFIHERDWEKYHNPKDLAESICIEAAELLQLFQWIESEESRGFKTDPSKLTRVKEELADVVICCLSMVNALEADLTEAVLEKLELNKKKYPADLYKGKAYFNHQKNDSK